MSDLVSPRGDSLPSAAAGPPRRVRSLPGLGVLPVLPALKPQPLPSSRLARGVAAVAWASWARRLEGSMLRSSGLLNPGQDLLMLGLLRMCR